MRFYSKKFKKDLYLRKTEFENTMKRVEIFLRTGIKPVPHIGNTNFGFTKENIL